MIESLEKILALAREGTPQTIAVVAPEDAATLEAVRDAADEKIAAAVLVGSREKIEKAMEDLQMDSARFQIVDAPDHATAAAKAVEMARNNEVGLLMKGAIHTDGLLKAVLNKETGLRKGALLSHAFAIECPTYHKILIVTDAAMNIAPTLEEKAGILQNAIDLARDVFEIPMPKAAILSAVETVNPKMTSTLDAALIAKMAGRGQITGALVEGPLAFDNAISAESARIKHIDTPVAGDPDIVLVPDIESGNILYKALVYLAKAEAAGIILGARVPIILTSRADSAASKLYSIALCAVASQKMR